MAIANIWHDIDPKRIYPTDFISVIEIPKGSKKKYELDKETGLLILDRILYTSTHYPANYGFIPRTYADDGDPLDVLLLCSEEIQPLTLVRTAASGMRKLSVSPIAIPPIMDTQISGSFQSIYLMKCSIFSASIRSLRERPPWWTTSRARRRQFVLSKPA